jgi:hypothetical protein
MNVIYHILKMIKRKNVIDVIQIVKVVQEEVKMIIIIVYLVMKIHLLNI